MLSVHPIFLLYQFIFIWHLVGASPTNTSSVPEHFDLASRALPTTWAHWPSTPQSSNKRGKIEQSFRDMATVVRAVLEADQTIWDAILPKYFLPKDSSKVREVLKSMVEPSSKDNDPSSGSDILANIIVNYLDTHARKVCSVPINKDEKNPIYATAYVLQDLQPSTLHLCDSDKITAYAYPDLDLTEKACQSLDAWVSVKMLSLGSFILVHELSHLRILSETAAGQFCFDKKIGDYGYGPKTVRELVRDDAAGMLPDKTKGSLCNADSYAWFANEVYWTYRCGHGYGAPQSNAGAPAGVYIKGKGILW